MTEKERTEPFPLEQITSMSAGDYCASKEKKLSDYDVHPIHVSRIDRIMGDTFEDIRIKLADQVSENTEIVTDYDVAIAMNNFHVIQYATGNVLIPKSKKQPPQKKLPDTGGPVEVKRFG